MVLANSLSTNSASGCGCCKCWHMTHDVALLEACPLLTRPAESAGAGFGASYSFWYTSRNAASPALARDVRRSISSWYAFSSGPTALLTSGDADFLNAMGSHTGELRSMAGVTVRWQNHNWWAIGIQHISASADVTAQRFQVPRVEV